MNKHLTLGGLMAISLLLVGAGCASESPEQATLPAEVEQETTSTIEQSNFQVENRIVLAAEQAGNRRVEFDWEVGGEVAHPNGYRLVRSFEENPVDDGTNYWFHQPNTRNHIAWINLPTGTQHFRICGYDENGCTIYSNNVTVDITASAAVKTEEVIIPLPPTDFETPAEEAATSTPETSMETPAEESTTSTEEMAVEEETTNTTTTPATTEEETTTSTQE